MQSDALSVDYFHDLAARHPGKTGVYVLEKGEESLLARAWFTYNASQTIDIQYFIWSTDNIGTLASEALLRAAERGVKVRVIVDDLLIDAEHDTLLAAGIELYAFRPFPMVQYNLNTEIGVQIESPLLAREVEARIGQDMHSRNSWNPLTDNPDAQAAFTRRIQLWFWELLPLEPIL